MNFKQSNKKIVTATEMARVEKLAIKKDDSKVLDFMRSAAKGMFCLILDLLQEHGVEKKITLLCAKGNNSGDGYCLASLLLEKGFMVTALQVTPLEEASPLCQKMAHLFQNSGGRVQKYCDSVEIMNLLSNTVVIDALLGTGFHGELKGEFIDVIQLCNQATNFVISIDIASGINGNTGKSSGVSVASNVTIYLENPKIGHFFEDGFESYDELLGTSFGLSAEFSEKLSSDLLMLEPELFTHHLPKRKKAEHKYSIGQVLVIGGSDSMTGAANLAALASLRSGAGIVKIFHPSASFVSGALELISIPLDFSDTQLLEKELLRSRSVCIGPGLSRKKGTKEFLDDLLCKITIPHVLDADALYFFKNKRGKAPCILTPHEGELKHLLQVSGPIDRLDLLKLAQQFVNTQDVILVYKGAPTIILAKGLAKVLIPFGQSAMATAGMGDVLSGIIAAMLLQVESAYMATILACQLHALAGQRAAVEKKQGLIASDCIHQIPYFLP